ncbi:MAG: ADP-ribosyltransferase [Lachnospiraceae bacterium]|nr:ADP-ribosyltransferase [Lachnospiraceae bacterium]
MCHNPAQKMKDGSELLAMAEDMDTMQKQEQLTQEIQTEVTENPVEQQVTKPQSVFDLAFDSLWRKETADFLHELALKKDVQDKVLKTKGEVSDEIKEARTAAEARIVQFNRIDTGRSEKTRRNHLTKSAKGFEKAAEAIQKLQAEREALDNAPEMSAKKKSFMIMENVDRAEAAINLMFESQLNSVMATGDNGISEQQTIDELKKKYTMSLLNLYREQANNAELIPAHKEHLIKKVSRLQVDGDTTRTRLFFAGSRVLKDYTRYDDMDTGEVLDQVKTSTKYNHSKMAGIYGFVDGQHIDDKGRESAYICSGHASRINARMRIEDDAHRLALLKAKNQGNPDTEEIKALEKRILEDDQALEKNLKSYFKFREYGKFDYAKWKDETAYVKKHLDEAVASNKLSKKTKFYRMVGNDILSWGFGLDEKAMKGDAAEIVDKLNKNVGMGFEDKGYMSVGWRVDAHFSDRPIMMTLLTEKGKKCFVTRNFKESEIIFGRNTKYMFVEAINHANDRKKITLSPMTADNSTTRGELARSMEEQFAGIELIMKVLPSDEQEWNDAVAGENALEKKKAAEQEAFEERKRTRKKASDKMN